MSIGALNPVDLFENIASVWDAPPLDNQMIKSAEETIGLRLPESYIDVLRYRNGGLLRRNEYPLYFEPLGMNLRIALLMGIGGESSIDTKTRLPYLSEFLLRQWGWPGPAVVISQFGHSGYILDYKSRCDNGEPSVVYLYGERTAEVLPVELNVGFASFISALYDP